MNERRTNKPHLKLTCNTAPLHPSRFPAGLARLSPAREDQAEQDSRQFLHTHERWQTLGHVHLLFMQGIARQLQERRKYGAIMV